MHINFRYTRIQLNYPVIFSRRKNSSSSRNKNIDSEKCCRRCNCSCCIYSCSYVIFLVSKMVYLFYTGIIIYFLLYYSSARHRIWTVYVDCDSKSTITRKWHVTLRIPKTTDARLPTWVDVVSLYSMNLFTRRRGIPFSLQLRD